MRVIKKLKLSGIKAHSLILLAAFTVLSSFILLKEQDKPALYIIGDSTVKNGHDRGDGGLWGWGHFFPAYFNTSIYVENDALGGTSSRSFMSKGLWDSVLVKLKPGDFVIMQFGHNDGGPLDDTARARGTIKGTGDESKEIYNPILKKHEVVHTYGWYMSKYINDTKAKGAIPIVCSPIPRNIWANGKVIRNNQDYGKWAKAATEANGAFFIDLNSITADKYDKMGPDEVKKLFPGDHTHTGRDGAIINALSVLKGLQAIKNCTLNRYLAVEMKD